MPMASLKGDLVPIQIVLENMRKPVTMVTMGNKLNFIKFGVGKVKVSLYFTNVYCSPMICNPIEEIQINKMFSVNLEMIHS